MHFKDDGITPARSKIRAKENKTRRTGTAAAVGEAVTISVVDHDERSRARLNKIMARAPGLRLLRSFATGAEAAASLLRTAPDVVIADIAMPHMDGARFVRMVTELLPESEILVLTACEDRTLVFRAFAAGASGYLLKRSSRDEIVSAIKRVSLGGAPMSDGIARKVVESFRPRQPKQPPGGPLTRREKEVLELLAKGRPTKEIANEMAISFDTVRFHLKNIYGKFRAGSRTEVLAKYLEIESELS
jgi:DNA-binding NarL/FixJ family response regulator